MRSICSAEWESESGGEFIGTEAHNNAIRTNVESRMAITEGIMTSWDKENEWENDKKRLRDNLKNVQRETMGLWAENGIYRNVIY